MTQDEIKLVLDKHKKWLNNEKGGECADLSDADLSNANLRDADLRDADLSNADLRDADLRDADLRDADLDYSCWPLWCGSLGVHIDDRIAMQLLYHTLCNVAYSKHVSDKIKRVLLTPELVELANRSHVVHHHGKPQIEPYKEEQET